MSAQDIENFERLVKLAEQEQDPLRRKRFAELADEAAQRIMADGLVSVRRSGPFVEPPQPPPKDGPFIEPSEPPQPEVTPAAQPPRRPKPAEPPTVAFEGEVEPTEDGSVADLFVSDDHNVLVEGIAIGMVQFVNGKLAPIEEKLADHDQRLAAVETAVTELRASVSVLLTLLNSGEAGTKVVTLPSRRA